MVANPFGPVHAYVNGPCGPHSSTVAPAQAESGPLIAHGSWEQEGNPPPGGVGAIRKVGRWPRFGREQVVRHDPPGHHAYVLLSGQPVGDYRADVYFRRDGDGTVITWGATFEPLIPGSGVLLAAVYRRMIGGFARRLAAYAEAHPS